MINKVFVWGPDPDDHRLTLLGQALFHKNSTLSIASIPPALEEQPKPICMARPLVSQLADQSLEYMLLRRLESQRACGFGMLAIEALLHLLENRSATDRDSIYGRHWMTGTGCLRVTQYLSSNKSIEPMVFNRKPDVSGSDAGALKRVLGSLAKKQKIMRPDWDILYGLTGLNSAVPAAPVTLNGKAAIGFVELSETDSENFDRITRLAKVHPSEFPHIVDFPGGIASLVDGRSSWSQSESNFEISAKILGDTPSYMDVYKGFYRVADGNPWGAFCFRRLLVSSVLKGSPADAAHEIFVPGSGRDSLKFAPLRLNTMPTLPPSKRRSLDEIITECTKLSKQFDLSPADCAYLADPIRDALR